MPREHCYSIYILTNQSNTTLYLGVTGDLQRRIHEHKTKFDPKSFTAKYNLTKLVYTEDTPDVFSALAREKQLKAGPRAKKIALIEGMNPEWRDLAEDWF